MIEQLHEITEKPLKENEKTNLLKALKKSAC